MTSVLWVHGHKPTIDGERGNAPSYNTERHRQTLPPARSPGARRHGQCLPRHRPPDRPDGGLAGILLPRIWGLQF
jgi:hypothetical protein